MNTETQTNELRESYRAAYRAWREAQEFLIKHGWEGDVLGSTFKNLVLSEFRTHSNDEIVELAWMVAINAREAAVDVLCAQGEL